MQARGRHHSRRQTKLGDAGREGPALEDGEKLDDWKICRLNENWNTSLYSQSSKLPEHDQQGLVFPRALHQGSYEIAG